MSVVQSFIKPIDSTFFPYSKAIIGHFIPGELIRYPVRIVNYPDYTSFERGAATKNPVTKFPSMNEDNAKGHPMMNTLKKLLTDSGPKLREGFQRMREDLGWRGVQARPAEQGHADLHGDEVAHLLGAGPGLDL